MDWQDSSQARDPAQQRAEAEQGLAITLAAIDAGFIATDADGRVTRMNTTAEQVTGWPQAEAQGRSLWPVFVREARPDAVLAQNPVALMRAQGITVEQAHRVITIARDGRRTALVVRAALTSRGDGTPQGLVLVFRDRQPLDHAAQAQQQLERRGHHAVRLRRGRGHRHAGAAADPA